MHELIVKAVEVFGLTECWTEAGYLLPDGTLLDFSGASEGGGHYGIRVLDHRYLYDVMGESGSFAMLKFMDTGAIRLNCSPDDRMGFGIIEGRFPTERQINALYGQAARSRDVYWDVFTLDYETIKSGHEFAQIGAFLKYLERKVA